MIVRICDWNDISSEISYIIICDTKWKQYFQQYHYQLQTYVFCVFPILNRVYNPKSLLWNFIFNYSRKRWPEDKYDAHNKSGNKIFLLVDFLNFLKKLRKMKYFHVCDNISTFTSRKVLRWNVQNMTFPMIYPCKFMFTIRGRVVNFDWISFF